MRYQAASDLLQTGKFIARPDWEKSFAYLVYLPGLTHYLQVILKDVTKQNRPNVIPWTADKESSNVADWIEVNPFDIASQLAKEEAEALAK